MKMALNGLFGAVFRRPAFVGLLDEMIACRNFKLRLLAFVLEAGGSLQSLLH